MHRKNIMLNLSHFHKILSAVQCERLPPDEQACGDGLNNDEDCLVDLDCLLPGSVQLWR